MPRRLNENDVTNRVNTTDPGQVAAEVCRIYQELYQQDTPRNLPGVFADLVRLYRGGFDGYHHCDTGYHNLQHVLDVTLAMARLMDGCVRGSGARVIDERLFRCGIIIALFHDSGYIRRRADTRHRNGAEYTLTHVSRGARFLATYLPTIGMADLVPPAAGIIHFTGYEIPVDRIRVDLPVFRLIGNLLGSADILAQMADRCYLEKCHERLYPEFVLGGIARKPRPDGTEEVLYGSPAELIFKTPLFYQRAASRLRVELGGNYACIENHFGGQNLYFDELEKNIDYARRLAADGDTSQLRRNPPESEPVDSGGSD